MENNQEKWIAFMSERDSEIWQEDLDGNSREDVIAKGMKYAKEEGLKSFQIGMVRPCSVPSIDIDSILDSLCDCLYDEVGESSEGYLDHATNEQMKELEESINNVIFEWHKKYDLFPECYTVINDEVIEVKYNEGR